MHSSLWISFYGFALFDWNWWFWSCSLEVLLYSSLSFCGFAILDWNLWFDLAPEKARTDTVFRLLLYICMHSFLNFFLWVCNTWLNWWFWSYFHEVLLHSLYFLFVYVSNVLSIFFLGCLIWLKLVILILLPGSSTNLLYLHFFCLFMHSFLGFFYGCAIVDRNCWFWSYFQEP